MPTDAQEPGPTADPLSGFRQALARYQERQAECADVERKINNGRAGINDLATVNQKLRARSIAAEELWVSGMGSFFNFLEANYKAQERVLDKQLDLAEKSARAADAVAWWTKALVVVTCVLILATIFTGIVGFVHR